MSEYEVHWLMDFPLIIYWARQEIIMVISQKKQTNKYKKKIGNFTVNRDHTYKK